MATKRIVPRASGEGGVGRSDKLMGPSYFTELGLSSKIRTQEVTVQTVNATPTVLWSKAIGNNEVSQVTVKAVAGDAAGVAGGSYARVCLVRKPGAGSAIIKGSGTMGADIETTTSMNMTWTVTGGNTLQLLATGLAGTTLTWRAEITTVTA